MLETHSCFLVIILDQQAGQESHSPLHRTAVSRTEIAGTAAEYSPHLTSRLTRDLLHAPGQKK